MPERDHSMAGKVCLITGATAGIGEAAARELARRGAIVVIVGRNRERCAATVESIRRDTGNEKIESITADLSSQRDVRRLASEFPQRHDRLNVLINNAGAIFALRRESVDSIEMTLALNQLAYFLLTNLLLDAIRQSAPARIINVSSSAHDDVKAFDFDDPQASTGPRSRQYGRSEFRSLAYSLAMPWRHPPVVQYAHSKLANLLFTTELSARLQGSGVTVNALHPGFVASNFTSGNGSLGRFMRIWSRAFGISPAEGAKTIIHLACSTEVKGVTGEYYVKEKIANASSASRDRAAASRLWRLSEELTADTGDARS